MANLSVYDWSKKEKGTTDFPSEFIEGSVREDLIQSVVRWQLACRRSGTHKAKTRSFVSGSSKKPFKQKGTGNARQGNIRSPLMEGGAVVFGPLPRDYSYTLPKKVKKLAFTSVLKYLNAGKRVFVVEDMTSDGKTNELAKKLKGFGIEKGLLIDEKFDEKFKRASKNLAKFRYNTVEGMNVFDMLKYENLVVTKAALSKVQERCRGAKS